MLDTLRKSTGSWVIKILFGVLILSFGIWGVGDLVQGGGGDAAIEVGAITYSARAVTEEFNRDVARLRRVLGNDLTEEDAQRMGLMKQTVQRMVSRATLEMGARSMGISAPDEVVRAVVTRRKEFLDEQGRFNHDKFLQLVMANGYSEEAFLGMLRTDIVRSHMLDPISLGAAPPKVLVETLYRRRHEKRVAETLTVVASSLPAPVAPTEAVLEAFHKEHAAAFTSPEFRKVTALILDEAAVVGEIEISDEALRTAYEQHQDEYHTPERRKLEQVLFESRELADAAATLIREGNGLASAANRAGGKPHEVISLDWVTRADILPQELADPVFSVPVNTVSAPLQSPFGWHLFHVSGSEAATTRLFAEVRDKLKKDLAQEKSIEVLYEMSGKIEDAISAGASLEDAARRFNLKTLTLPAMDRSGFGEDGKPVAGLPKAKEFLPTVFSSEQGREGSLVEGEGGYFVLRVDTIVPAALRPLASVRAQVAEKWVAAQRKDAARKKAGELLEQLKAGVDARALAANSGAVFALTPPLQRTGEASLPPSLLADLFARAPGETAMAESAEGTVVARLKEIIPANPAADPGALAELAGQVKTDIGNDLMTEFTAALGREFDIKVNRRVLEER